MRIIDQVAKALYAAHTVGLLHLDIKPSNILLDDDDFAYLIDFGIARMTDETRMTKSGHMIGTLQYIAPERLDSQSEEDARADIYSLACVLYEALTGQPPFWRHHRRALDCRAPQHPTAAAFDHSTERAPSCRRGHCDRNG